MNSDGIDRQLATWRGEFGDGYIGRNRNTESAGRSRLILWSHILPCLQARAPRTILEVGANIGNNLVALRALTDATLYGLEPNRKARQIMVDNAILAEPQVLDGTAQSIALPSASMDMVFTCGVLIHIAPENLEAACGEIFRVARRYIVCVEYFSAELEAKAYRGCEGLLFKNDFGSIYLDQFEELRLIGYGFLWKRVTGLDNLTWWAFAKDESAC